MNTILKTNYFKKWLLALRDLKARAKIISRIEKAEQGNFGDHHNVDGPIWEMRLFYGPGYRIYYAQQGKTIYILLCGGDKHSQDKDIETAKEIWEEING